MDRAFLSKLITEIDEVKIRISRQTVAVESAGVDDLIEQQAELRNMVMRLQGLELMLRKTEEQAFGS